MVIENVQPEYVIARQVLLDALDALEEHRSAVVVAGAQAVYLRARPGILAVSDYTTDGDLTLDPALLGTDPAIEKLMSGAGFKLAVVDETSIPGTWETEREIEGVPTRIPVDLIVPEGVAPPGGRRGARLEGHDKLATRKSTGLEAALVDNDPMRISALEAGDDRSYTTRVAGTAALIVAKVHKITDRLSDERFERLRDKDASDVIRLMQSSRPAEIAATLAELREHPSAGAPTNEAIDSLFTLFGRRGGEGIAMATRALNLAMPPERVRETSLAYGDALRSALT